MIESSSTAGEAVRADTMTNFDHRSKSKPILSKARINLKWVPWLKKLFLPAGNRLGVNNATATASSTTLSTQPGTIFYCCFFCISTTTYGFFQVRFMSSICHKFCGQVWWGFAKIKGTLNRSRASSIFLDYTDLDRTMYLHHIYIYIYVAQPCNAPPTPNGHGPVGTLSDIVDILLAYKWSM